MLHHSVISKRVCLLLFFFAGLTATSVAQSYAPPKNVHELSERLGRLGFSSDGNISGSIAWTSNDRPMSGQASCSTAVSNPL